MNAVTSKDSFSQLIVARTMEKNIQEVLQTDLSLLGEVYANPKPEYICFSEFPIGTGRADFVIFTGRSRMEILVIEIKGANFNFSNSNSYGNIAAKINEAALQMRKRLNYISANYDKFRSFAHWIRDKVENGEQIYNSFLGPSGYLEVDPDKDIRTQGIIIGGRCRDDLYESRLRHEYETIAAAKISIESWDSWVKKLTRE